MLRLCEAFTPLRMTKRKRRLRHPPEKAFPQDAELFPPAQGDSCSEDVVLSQCNLFEKCTIDVDEHPECRLTVFGDVGDQFVAGRIELAGAVSFLRQNRAEPGRIGNREYIRQGEIELRQIFLRQVNASEA